MILVRALVLVLVFALVGRAESIKGTIIIRKKLTKRSVTAAIPVYQRGPVAGLGKNAEQGQDSGRDLEKDPLAFERSQVVVWIEGPGVASAAAKTPITAVMAQTERRFIPDTLVIPVGASISFPNQDPIFHNVFSLSKPRSFDLGNYSKGDTRYVTFTRPGIVYVDCHLHPNMAGAIVITPNQWYAKADGMGRFGLLDLPPGEYTVVASHRAAGLFRKSVQLLPGHDSSVNFSLPIGQESE